MTITNRHSSYEANQVARRWLMGGRVQGVGYRGFVFNLAKRLDLHGVVQNLTGEVLVEAQGDINALAIFAAALITDAPPLARPHIVSCEAIAVRELNDFEILSSAASARSDIHIPTDIFLCDDCRHELNDPQDIRYLYPFINCTQCGPRYTIITGMPYDRPNTTMAEFVLCSHCRAEYENPFNRRFHAQPLACPVCGPTLTFSSPQKKFESEAALKACIEHLQHGDIVAVKGIGGYHLMCDAHNPQAVTRLRLKKNRPDKPLAVMFPWQGADGLQAVRDAVQLDAVTEQALCDASRPIVLVPRCKDSTLIDDIAPGLTDIGVMLPYSPLHYLLLDTFGRALVATSGNVSGEPVLTDNAEAETRLANVTSYFLHHNRDIARPADDSVLRIIATQPRVLRAGRGMAPLEFDLPFHVPRPMLAVGAHMKNTVALAWNNRMVMSPHIGDLDAPRSLEIFEKVIADLQQLYDVNAKSIVCDLHTGYTSSRWAKQQTLPITRVQHHRAHASALAFEKDLDKTWLCFTWDGVGFGDDGTLWGGETLLGRAGDWVRVASFKSFRLPGGERAGREPWRSAAALCWENNIAYPSDKPDVNLLKHAWQQDLNAPVTTAVGRLFDGVSSLLGLIDSASFEGYGPMLLEATAQGDAEVIELPLRENENGLLVADWTPLLHAMLRNDVSVAQRAMQFHLSLAQLIVAQATRIARLSKFDLIGLTGGVFQNKLLAELAIKKLHAAGFDAHMPQRVPCNDGGLALGQLLEAACQNG